MLCTTTHDGWMDDKSKLAWLNVCIEDGTNPYGERPQLSNFDGHWSNETIEYSARMEEAQVTGSRRLGTTQLRCNRWTSVVARSNTRTG